MNPLAEHVGYTLGRNTGKNACATAICFLFAPALFADPCRVLPYSIASGTQYYEAVTCIAADSGFIVTGANVTFQAGSYIHLGNGFHAQASFEGFITPAVAPSAVSVTPSGLSGSAQTFAFNFSDPKGAVNIVSTFVDVAPTLSGVGACYLYYAHGMNLIYLADDSGNLTNAPLTVGVAGTKSNIQCTVDAGASWVTASGNTLTLNLAVSFKTAFAGAKNIYMTAYNGALSCDWVQRGTWTVTAPPSQLTITTSTPLQNATTGAAYSQPLNAAGGVPAYSWSLASGSAPLPAGLSFSGGGLSGTPTTAGTYAFQVKVTDSTSQTATKNVSLTVSGSTPDFALAISPGSATVSTGLSYPYTVALTCFNGFAGPVSLTAPMLPPGVTAVYGTSTLNCGSGSSTTLTVSTTTDASGYDVTVTGSGGVLGNRSAMAQLTVASGDLLLGLRNCVSSATGANCNLTPGAYSILQGLTVAVNKSNVTVSGDSNNPTMLVRAAAHVDELMTVNDPGSCGGPPPSPTCTGIRIQNLTFCSGSTNTVVQQADPSNPCPRTQLQNQTLCEANHYPCVDLNIQNTAPPQSWAAPAGAPFNSVGPYNLEITYCRFEDSSSGHPVLISPAGSQRVNDVYIHNNVISAGGVQMGASNGTNWGDYTQCDNWSAKNTGVAFADDNTPGVPVTPRNIRFGDPGTCQPGTQCSGMNTFYSTAGAISGQGRYVGIYNNTFKATLGGVGGAIEQEVCSDRVNIIGNTLTGGSPDPAVGHRDEVTGTELYGRNMNVSGNTVSGFTLEGIGLFSVYNSSANGNHLYSNDLVSHTGFVDGDIKVRTAWPGDGTCTPAYPGNLSNPVIPAIGAVTCDAFRDTQGLTIQSNDSQGAATGAGNVQYGVYLTHHEGSSTYVGLAATTGGGVTAISGTNLNVGNVANIMNQGSYGAVVYHPRVAVDTSKISGPAASVMDYTYPGYDPSNPTPISSPDKLPQSISIFPEGNQPLGKPLGTTDPGAGQPEGTNHRFFRFGGNDPGGASNIAHIQGFLSTDACPALAAVQSLGLPDVPPSGVGGPYDSDTPPQTRACNQHGQPVGPAIPPNKIYTCGFLFASSDGGPTGTVYLEDANHQFPAADSSPLGSTSGHTVQNSFCAIDASKSSVQPVPAYCQNCTPNDVVVVLDIELLKNDCEPLYPVDPLHLTRTQCTWFMYEVVENNQLRFNISNQGDLGNWSLWGYWKVTSVQ